MQDLHSTSYLPRAEARSPSGRRQPVPDRTLGAQGQRPSGAINPHAHQGVSTFGNTASRRFFTKPMVSLTPKAGTPLLSGIRTGTPGKPTADSHPSHGV